MIRSTELPASFVIKYQQRDRSAAQCISRKYHRALANNIQLERCFASLKMTPRRDKTLASFIIVCRLQIELLVGVRQRATPRQSLPPHCNDV